MFGIGFYDLENDLYGVLFRLVQFEYVVGGRVLPFLMPLFAHFDVRRGVRLENRRRYRGNSIDLAHRFREASVLACRDGPLLLHKVA